MGLIFSVELPFGFDPTNFDVLEFEPDIDGIDWLEEDPLLPDGTANLYVHGQSTVAIGLHLDDEFEVWVHGLASEASWQIAFDVLQHACETFGTVFVTWNDNEVWELEDLRLHCNADWQRAQFEADVLALANRIEAENSVAIPGPIRETLIGQSLFRDIQAQVTSVEAIILRTNYINGPHLAAQSVVEKFSDGPKSVSVLGPGLRTLLPPCDAVLIDTIEANRSPVLVSSNDLSKIDGLSITFLDEVHQLVNAVPDKDWPAVLDAALPFSLGI
jgi:hypothetical protein